MPPASRLLQVTIREATNYIYIIYNNITIYLFFIFKLNRQIGDAAGSQAKKNCFSVSAE